MKKVIAICCILTMLFCLTSCGIKSKPEDTVSKFCDALKISDIETLASCFADTTSEEIQKRLTSDGEFLTSSLLEVFKEKLTELEYTIEDTVVNEDKAEVTVHFLYADISPAARAATGEYMSQAFALAFSDSISEEELGNYFGDIFVEKAKSMESNTLEATIVFNCFKNEKTWFISEIPDGMTNIVTSNFEKTMDSMFNDIG